MEMGRDQFVKDCIEWDVVNWSKALGYWEKNLELSMGKLDCLELGGRSGGLSLWLASKGNSVICSDLKNPKDSAEVIHSKYKLSGDIIYQSIDATNIQYENRFDIIIFKSILGGISRNKNEELISTVINQILKALKPGGKLLFVENLKSSFLHQHFREHFVRWGADWNYLHSKEIRKYFEDFEELTFECCGFLGTFGRSEFQKNILGKIDSIVFDKILPNNLKYVVYGIATKPSVRIS